MSPTRSRAQRTGDRGENFVHGVVDEHPDWVSRRQDKDFGVDLEAECAPRNGPDQALSGQLLKIQVKGSEDWSCSGGRISISLDRNYLDYVGQFRLPVILVAADVSKKAAYYVWLQEWLLRNEVHLARSPTAKTVTVHLPAIQTLASGLDGPLKRIVRGQEETTTILALRELIKVARSNRDQLLFDGVMDILTKVDIASSHWTIAKIIEDMVNLGPHAGLWRASEFVPALLSLVQRLGSAMTTVQVVSMVGRDDTYSRAGLYGLTRLYDVHFEAATGLGLVAAFRAADIQPVAWYCAFREFYDGRCSIDLIGAATAGGLETLSFEGLTLALPQDNDVFSKWVNRGDSVLLDHLV